MALRMPGPSAPPTPSASTSAGPERSPPVAPPLAGAARARPGALQRQHARAHVGLAGRRAGAPVTVAAALTRDSAGARADRASRQAPRRGPGGPPPTPPPAVDGAGNA